MSHNLVIAIADVSQVGAARRTAAELAQKANLSETDQGHVAIIVTELGTNLIRHAGHGNLLLRALPIAGGGCIEMLAVDRGPGMADPDRCLQDGFSTSGTSGNGLGAVRRLATEFDLFSAPSLGTAVMARVGGCKQATDTSSGAWGAISVPCPGEEVCGDSWSLVWDSSQFAIMVADGLGHGPLASEAAVGAIATFEAHHQEEPRQILEYAHKALSGTRGAAVAAARFDNARYQLKYAGVGNISGVLLTSTGSRGLFSHNGTIGVQLRRVQQFEYPCEESRLLIMHSDGLKSRWNFDKYPGLSRRHPAIIAGILYRDFGRGRDDVTIVVVRLPTTRSELR